MRDGVNRSDGTRFRIYPRPPFVHPDWPPEVVTVSNADGPVGPGPSDRRVYLINPIGKALPYGVNPGPLGTPHLDLPPWPGRAHPPVFPDAEGHFDHLTLGEPGFEEAHVFGTIRFTLDLWQRYFGRRIEWHFASSFNRLEVVMLPDFDNSHAGWGFMEVGSYHYDDGRAALPFSLNFDVVSHELGHLLIYSTVGVPKPETEEAEYFGFQESAADTVAMIAALHFESLIARLLEETHGNLYTYNELDRFAELSATDQIRLASNSVRMSQFAVYWDDEHLLSQPLTGAVFDILVDIFQENLVERGVIARGIADLTEHVSKQPDYVRVIQPVFDAAYAREPDAFHAALISARDYLGVALAETWLRLSADFFTYETVGTTLLAVDRALSGGRYREEISESFSWREIGAVKPGPRHPRSKPGHTGSARTLVPEVQTMLPNMSYHERMLLARGSIKSKSNPI